MMQKTFFKRCLTVPIVACLMLAGCSSSEPRVHIRIKNNGPEDIAKFWLGAGGPNDRTEAYGAIPNGHLTEYRDIAPVLSKYRKYNYITANDKIYLDVVYPEHHIGHPILAPGNYTFNITQEAGQSRLKLVKD